jgi:tetratricopeptide (TPR) repeat protein
MRNEARPWMIVGLMLLWAGPSPAQSVRSLVNGGNGLYQEKKYGDAEVNYRKALEKEPALVQGHFNLGNSLYKQGKYDESSKEYVNAIEKAEGKETKAKAYYNIGNSLAQSQNYQDAVKSYVESLKLMPEDQETKYNLSYALAKLGNNSSKREKCREPRRKEFSTF